MIEGVRKFFERRSGRAQAEYEMRVILEGRFTPEEMTNAIEKRLGQFGGRNDFRRAYAGRWFDEGWRDAKSGRIRSDKFQRLDYDFGWMEYMKKMRDRGFVHQFLEGDYQRLVKSHVDKDCRALWGLYE